MRAWLSTHGPGFALVLAVVAMAYGVSRAPSPWPISASLVALMLGLALHPLARSRPATAPGTSFALKRALTWGVVLLGAEVDLAFLARAGPLTIVVAALLIVTTLGVFRLLAHLLRLEGDTWALLGAGTAVCGLSAAVAAGASLGSKQRDITIAAAGVGILSAVGLLLYPLIGLATHMPEAVYGAWSGLSIHAVANAVAAGFAISDPAGQVATVTKLTRVSLLAPALVAVSLMARRNRRHERRGLASFAALLPPMAWGFLALIVLFSVVPFPPPLVAAVRGLTRFLLLTGMAGLGLTTRLGDLREVGWRGLVMASLGWAFLSAAALAGAFVLFG